MSHKLGNYINGKMVPPSTGKYIPNINPSTGEINNLVPSSDERDVNAAVKAAKKVQNTSTDAPSTPHTRQHSTKQNKKAFKTWKNTPISKRAEYCQKIVVGILKRRDELALAEATDMGKPISEYLEGDFPTVISHFQAYARAVKNHFSPFPK